MAFIVISLLFAASIAIVDWRRNRTSPKFMTFIAIVMFYFMFGSIISYTLGLPIHNKIDTNYIRDAAFICTLSFGAYSVGGILGTLRSPPIAPTQTFVPTTTYQKLVDALFVATSLAGLAFALFNIDRLGGPKDISTFWSGHYRFLLAWMLVFIVRFAIKFQIDWITIVCTLVFTFYCIVFSERDFIFIVVCIFYIYYGSRKSGYLVIISVLVAAVAATWLLTLGRGDLFDAGLITSLLNQSPNTFVDVFTIKYVEGSGELFWGWSYLVSAIKTVTFNQVYLSPPLAEWLVIRSLGPSALSVAGYGFSLEAEAYLNFGYAGSVVIFFSIGYLIGYLLTAERMQAYGVRVIAVFVMTMGAFAVRGEAINLFKPAFFVLLLILLLRGAAWLIDQHIERRSARA